MKILVFGLLILSLIISGCAENRVTTELRVQSSTIEIKSGNLKYPAYIVAYPDDEKKPARMIKGPIVEII